MVKGVDLRSTAGKSAWARTPQLTSQASLGLLLAWDALALLAVARAEEPLAQAAALVGCACLAWRGRQPAA